MLSGDRETRAQAVRGPTTRRRTLDRVSYRGPVTEEVERFEQRRIRQYIVLTVLITYCIVFSGMFL